MREIKPLKYKDLEGLSEKQLKEHHDVLYAGYVKKIGEIEEKKLKNIICDSHNQGGVWNSIALLIMDVYEHAYFIDYATGRKAYIDAFFKNIDWQHTDKLMSKFGDIFLEG